MPSLFIYKQKFFLVLEERPRELDLNRFPIHVNSYYNMKLEVSYDGLASYIEVQ